MIVLDSNVISALMRTEPDLVVLAWLDTQPATSVWTTSICVFEIRFGINILAPGKRRHFLDKAFDRVLREALAGRVLDFDNAAATTAAKLHARLRAQGVGIEWRDLQIASIAATHNGTLATRNTKHFTHTGITLIDPWSASEAGP
ncbi:MAG: type II toxin-antitoxin system VapC family toxin [Algisphaera sp.]